MAKYCNSYGFTAGIAAAAMVAAFFIVQKKECQLSAYDNLQILHVVAGICGVVVFVTSFVNIAGMLHEIKLLFIAAVLVIFGIGCSMFYATYLSFVSPCVSLVSGLIPLSKDLLADKPNVVKSEDTEMIIVTCLDLLAALLLIGAAISFQRRV